MKISEIYAGIEGEGVNVGTPQIFIRTQGCSIQCKNCDSKYTWDSTKGKDLTSQEVLAVLQKNKYQLNNISITGGNPLEQKEMQELVELLHRNNYSINIEVTGQDYNELIFRTVDFISCDIKTPSTGIEANLDIIHKIARKYDFKSQFKCVVSNEKDLDFVIKTYREIKNRTIDLNVVITPAWGTSQEKINVELIKKIQQKIFSENLPIKIIVQQHKCIFGVKATEV